MKNIIFIPILAFFASCTKTNTVYQNINVHDTTTIYKKQSIIGSWIGGDTLTFNDWTFYVNGNKQNNIIISDSVIYWIHTDQSVNVQFYYLINVDTLTIQNLASPLIKHYIRQK